MLKISKISGHFKYARAYMRIGRYAPVICPSVTAEEQEIVIIIKFGSLIVGQILLKIHQFGIDKSNDLPASVVDLESVNSFKKA